MTTDTNRPQDKIRKVTINLKEVQQLIPRNAEGDPAFEELGIEHLDDFGDIVEKRTDNSVMSVFTTSQITVMVNRYLYQAEYQQKSHRDYHEGRKKVNDHLKAVGKRLYPGISWTKWTDEQIAHILRVAAGKEGVE